MSPIGPWPDFAACVAANQDKSSPEGFCAWLEHKQTGKWPSEASKVSPDVLAAFDAQADMALSTALASFHFQAPATRTVHGVEVFAAGSWADSAGQKREWTIADLKAMVKAFSPGSVPLKAGHTSPEFNRRVAAALGVPVELLQGDLAGKGQMALGHMAKLALRGEKLVADFEGVPAPLAEMIEGGQYTSVSSEIEIDSQGQLKLSAVALLGVEEPAVGLAGLGAAAVFGKRENALVFSFSHKQEGDMADKLKAESTLKEIAALFQDGAGGNQDALVAIATMLGLDPTTATLADILKACQAMKAGMPAEKGEPVPAGMAAEHSKMRVDFAALQETMKAQAATIATFEHERRVSKYTRMAEGWAAIPGKPEEFGAQLAETEEKAGEKVAVLVSAQFQAANEAAKSAGVLLAVGRSKMGMEPTDEFEKAVRAKATKDGSSYEVALAQMSTADPKGFFEFRARKNGS